MSMTMKRSAATLAPLVFLLASLVVSMSFGCNALSNITVFDYAVNPPEELKHDFSADFQNKTGMLPDVDCTANANLCSAIMNQPMGATTSCDDNPAKKGSKHCSVRYDVRYVQLVDLSKQATFPPQVASSGALSLVQVDRVGYWTTENSLNFATPPLDIYVGSAAAMTEAAAGVQKLGTIAPIPAGANPSALPDCTKPATSAATACNLQMTPAGQMLLATLAKDLKSPFNVIIVGHLTINAGDAIPSGAIDLFVQPVIGFHL